MGHESFNPNYEMHMGSQGTKGRGISRRELFGRFSSPKQISEPVASPQELPGTSPEREADIDPVGMAEEVSRVSRRKVLRDMALGTGLILGSGGVAELYDSLTSGEVYASNVQNRKSTNPSEDLNKEEAVPLSELEKKEKWFEHFLEELKEIESNFDKDEGVAKSEDRTVEQIEELHALVVSQIKGDIEKAVSISVELSEDKFRKGQTDVTKFSDFMLYTQLASTRCHGLFLSAVRETEGISHSDILTRVRKFGGEAIPSYFSIYASDYLPEGDEINIVEIDPRQYFLNRGKPDLYAKVKWSIDKIPGWNDPGRQKEFRNLLSLDNELGKKTRLICASNGLTLAEAYSFVKAIIVYKEHNPHQDYDVICANLLNKRESFLGRVLVGKHTQSCINFTLHTPDKTDAGSPFFNSERKLELLKDLGVETISTYVCSSDDDEKSIKDQVSKIEDEIAKSSGNSVVFLSSHGMPDGSYELKPGSVYWKPEQIALGLYNRLLESNEREKPIDLNKVVIITESCFGYKFAQELRESLSEMIKKDDNLKNIDLDTVFPTVVALSDEGSPIFGGSETIIEYMNRHIGAFRGRGLTGADLMKKVQPDRYLVGGDITFFDSASSMELIGKVENRNKNQMVA